jgi:hypothetical protein
MAEIVRKERNGSALKRREVCPAKYRRAAIEVEISPRDRGVI